MVIKYRCDVPDDIMDRLSYDPATGVFLKKSCYFKSRIGQRADFEASDGYRRVVVGARVFLAHRLAWYFVHGVLPNSMIDHRNGVSSDNRIENLRLASGSENNMNRKNPPDRALPKGVTFNKALGRFQAQVTRDRRSQFLGLFDSPEAAHAAYCEAASRLHGDFARFA